MANLYYVGTGTTGSPTGWNSTSYWSTSSGGASGASVPGSADTAIFDSNSGSCTTDIAVTVHNLTIAGGTGGNYGTGSFSHFNLGAALTVSVACIVGGSASSNVGLFATNGYACLIGRFQSLVQVGSGGSVDIDITNSSFSLTGPSGTLFEFLGGTFTCPGSTIHITDTGSGIKTFEGLGTYNNITITAGGTGAVIFNNLFTCSTFTCTGPKTLTFEAGMTFTFSAFNVSGSASHLVTINSSAAGTAAILACSATVSCTYVSLKDNTASGGSFYYDPNSVIVSNVTGWSAAPGAMVGMLGVLG